MDVNGLWYNELNSIMYLEVKGKELNGLYMSAVGDAAGPYELVGFVDAGDETPTLGWVVTWQNSSKQARSVITTTTMPSDIQSSSEEEMLWEWARVEIESPRFKQCYQALADAVKRVVVSNRPDQLSDADRTAVIQSVAVCRSPLLAGLHRLGTTWHRATIDTNDLMSLQIMHYPPFNAICPSHRLADFVRLLDKGIAPAGEPQFLTNYSEFRKRSHTHINGYPILVANAIE